LGCNSGDLHCFHVLRPGKHPRTPISILGRELRAQPADPPQVAVSQATGISAQVAADYAGRSQPGPDQRGSGPSRIRAMQQARPCSRAAPRASALRCGFMGWFRSTRSWHRARPCPSARPPWVIRPACSPPASTSRFGPSKNRCTSLAPSTVWPAALPPPRDAATGREVRLPPRRPATPGHPRERAYEAS
jgi:hypothetical protein